MTHLLTQTLLTRLSYSNKCFVSYYKISNLKLRAESISKQLNGWHGSLNNTSIKGAKFLTEKERKSYHQRRDLEEFDAEMRQ